MIGLVSMLSKHGDAIEADFQQYYGLDIAAIAQEGRFKRLLRLLRHLPPESRIAALQADSAVATGELPDVASWGRTDQLLAQVHDQLAIANWQRAGGKKKPVLLTDAKNKPRRKSKAAQNFGQQAVLDALTEIGPQNV